MVTLSNFAGWLYFLQTFAANLKPKLCHRSLMLLAKFYKRRLGPFIQSRSSSPICKSSPSLAWIENKETIQCSDFERLNDIPAEDTASEKESRDTMSYSDIERLDDITSNI